LKLRVEVANRMPQLFIVMYSVRNLLEMT